MVDLAKLDELIARVEKATSPDTAIDHDIEWEFGEWVNLGGWWREHKSTGARERYQYTPAPAYTASIDAALGLVERMLPGWMVVNLCEWEADVLRARGAWLCCLKKIGTQDDFTAAKGKADHAPSAPLAIILALLHALRESSERGR